MSFRLSIFSFETLSVRPRLSKSVILAVLIFAGARAGLECISEATLLFPGPAFDANYVATEKLIRDYKTSPRVLLMGDSIIGYGLREDVFAELSALREEEVINVGINAGGPQEALWLFHRNPKLLKQAELVIINVSRWMVNQNRRQTRSPAEMVGIRPLFYKLANLNDRLFLDRPRELMEAMLDLLFRHLAEKRSLRDWGRGFLDAFRGTSSLRLSTERVWWNKEFWELHVPDENFQPSKAARAHMMEFFISRRMQNLWKEFLQLCHSENLRIVILHPPNPLAYQSAFVSIPGALEGERQYWDFLHELRQQAVVLAYPTPTSAGLEDSDFLDYGHLTKLGATKFTRLVVRELATRSLLPRTAGATREESAGARGGSLLE